MTSRRACALGSCGLRVLPGVKAASSVVTVLPRMIAPASRRRSTIAASSNGRRPLSKTVPFSVGRSRVSMMSFRPTGTPCSGPVGRPVAAKAVGRLRLPHGVVGIEMLPGLHLRLALGDARKARFRQLDGLDRAARDLVARLNRGQVGKVGAARRPSRLAAVDQVRQPVDRSAGTRRRSPWRG